MQSASWVSVKCKPKNFWVESCDSGNLQVSSYNLASLWVVSCELIIKLWVGSRISLYYINLALSAYIIPSVRVKKVKAITEYDIFQLWYASESNPKTYCNLNENELKKYASIYANIDSLHKQLFRDIKMTIYANIDSLHKQLFRGIKMALLQILENAQGINHSGILF